MSELSNPSDIRMTTYRPLKRIRKAQFQGRPSKQRSRADNLSKLRAVTSLLSTPWGKRRAAFEAQAEALRSLGLRAAPRTLYRWRKLFLRSGCVGIETKPRSDFGHPHSFGEEMMSLIATVALMPPERGLITREYRKLPTPKPSYETFRVWTLRLRLKLRLLKRRGAA